MQAITDTDRTSIKVTVEAGDTQLIDIPAGATLVLDFDPELVTFALSGDDLVISAQDGGATILHDYAIIAAGTDAPEIQLSGGELVPGGTFLASLETGHFDMNTAAGDNGAMGSGSGEYMDQAGHFLGAGGDFGGALSGGDEHTGFGHIGFDGGAHYDSPDSLLNSGDVATPYEMVTFDDAQTSSGVSEFHLGPWTIMNGTADSDTLVSDGSKMVGYGNGGDDLLVGGSGSDSLFGGDGSDTLYGGSSSDQLDGGAGNDILYASTGHDYVTFGSGEDTLIVQENALGSGSYIEVKDYDIGIDIIDLRGDLDITGVTKTAAGDYEFTATGSTGDTSTIHLAGVDAADYSAHIAGIDASPDDLIQYMIDHSQALA